MTQDEIIEMAREAGFDCYGKHITWDDVICTDELKAFAKLVAAKAIAELESQNIKQITVKDFVHMVEGKEDLIGRPVYFAQWPNGNAHPPQRTWVGLTIEEITDEFYKFETASVWYQFAHAIEAKLKQKNGYFEEKNT